MDTTDLTTGLTADAAVDLTPTQRAFLAAYSVTGCISHAARAAGCDRGMHYHSLDRSTAYAEAFAAAREEATDHLEQEARRRAMEGVRQYRFTKDGLPIRKPGASPDDPDPWYFDVTYSDRLLELLLRAHRPEIFRDRVSQEITGRAGLVVVEDAGWYGNDAHKAVSGIAGEHEP